VYVSCVLVYVVFHQWLCVFELFNVQCDT